MAIKTHIYHLAKNNIKFPLKYDADGQIIFDGDGNIFLNIRGWGSLQYLENGEQIQDAVGEFVVEILNRENSKDD